MKKIIFFLAILVSLQATAQVGKTNGRLKYANGKMYYSNGSGVSVALADSSSGVSIYPVKRTNYDSLFNIMNDSTGRVKAIRFQFNAGVTITKTIDDSTLFYDITGVAPTSAAGLQQEWIIAASDETTNITTGTAKVTFRVPYAVTVTGVRASLSTASSSGIPTININENGTTILSTKLTIDASEKTSTTAATAAVISDTDLANDAEITIDFDVAGTGAKGVKIIIYYTKN